MDEAKIIGRVIRGIRREKELSQFVVSSQAEINLSYYCKIERGETNLSLKKLFSILRVLEVTPSQFIELVCLERQFLIVSTATSPLLD